MVSCLPLFSGFSPQGEGWVACLIPTGLGKLVYVQAPLGWSSWFYGFPPPGKRVSELLSPGGQGRLHVYSPLGEWVYFGYFPLGMLGFVFFIVFS